MQHAPGNKLNAAQLNLIKTFRFLHNEQELNEIDSLINFYLERRLDDAITKVETEQNYNADVYESWLNTANRSATK